jgi:hypothetical protein
MERAGPFRALEHRFEVHSELPGAVDVVSRLFAPFADRGDDGGAAAYELRVTGGDPPYQIMFDGEVLTRSIDAGNLFDWLITDVGRRALASPHNSIAIHAGAVSLDGRGIMLPAPPDHGKSTLSTALVRAGCSFLSDEAALIDPVTMQVWPFPRPILLSPDSVALFPGLEDAIPVNERRFRNYRFHLTADDVRPGSWGEPCGVELIVVPSYAAHLATELEPLPRAEALTLAISGCFNADRLDPSAVRILGSIVERAQCYRLRMGDVGAAAEAILSLLDGTFPV